MFCGYIGNEGKDFGTMRKSDVKTFSSSLTGFYILPPSPEMLGMREAGSYCASRCRYDDAVTGKNVCLISKKAKENIIKKGKKKVGSMFVRLTYGTCP